MNENHHNLISRVFSFRIAFLWSSRLETRMKGALDSDKLMLGNFHFNYTITHKIWHFTQVLSRLRLNKMANLWRGKNCSQRKSIFCIISTFIFYTILHNKKHFVTEMFFQILLSFTVLRSHFKFNGFHSWA